MNSEGSQSSLADVGGGKQRITRRKFLLGAGAAAGLAALAPRTASAEVVEYAEDAGLWVAGVVHSIELPNTLHIAGPQDPLTIDDTVRFSEDAAFWRDRAATLADFEVGDDVFVEGRWEGDVFLGTYLTCLWRGVEGSIVTIDRLRFETTGIVAIDPPRLETTGGIIRLIPESRVPEGKSLTAVSLDDFVIGANIWATGRFDQNTEELFAQKIGRE